MSYELLLKMILTVMYSNGKRRILLSPHFCIIYSSLDRNSVDPLHTSHQVEPIHEPPVGKPKEDEFQFKEIVFSAESHLNYFSEDLIKHKTNLPVEQLEKQVRKIPLTSVSRSCV